MSESSPTDVAIGAVINKLSALVDAHGAEAVALGADVMRLQAAEHMIWPIGILMVGAGSAIAAKRFWARYCKLESENEYGDHDGWAAAAIFVGILALGTIGIGTIGFWAETVSPLNWATLFDGRIGLAAKILGRI